MKLSAAFKSLSQEVSIVPPLLAVDRLPSLNGIRAIAVLYVIASHAILRLDHNRLLIMVFSGGRLGVQAFFVLSGFLITVLLLKEKIATGRISLRDFYARRVLRIFPVAWLYLLIIFVLGLHIQQQLPARFFLGAMFCVMNFRYYSLNNWFTGHYWSLSIEEQFYLLFPSILSKNYKLYIRFLLAVLCFAPLATMLQLTLSHFNHQDPVALFILRNPAVFLFFEPLAIGSLLAICVFKDLLPISLVNRYKLALHAIGIPLIILLFNNRPPAVYGIILGPIISIICSILIALLIFSNLQRVPGNDSIFDLLNSRLFNFIGILSYSLYIFNNLFTIHIGTTMAALYPTYHLPIWLNLLLLFTVAWLSYRFFEKPMLRLKRKFRRVRVKV